MTRFLSCSRHSSLTNTLGSALSPPIEPFRLAHHPTHGHHTLHTSVEACVAVLALEQRDGRGVEHGERGQREDEEGARVRQLGQRAVAREQIEVDQLEQRLEVRLCACGKLRPAPTPPTTHPPPREKTTRKKHKTY